MRKFAPKQRIDQACGGPDERPRPAPRQGRHEGGDLRQLPRRARRCASRRRATPVYLLKRRRECSKSTPRRALKAYKLPGGSAADRPAVEGRAQRPPDSDGQKTDSRRRPATTAMATTARRRPASARWPPSAARATPSSSASPRAGAHRRLRARLCRVPQQPRYPPAQRRDARRGQGARVRHVPQRRRQRAGGRGGDALGGIEKLKTRSPTRKALLAAAEAAGMDVGESVSPSGRPATP